MSQNFIRVASLGDIRPGTMRCARIDGRRILLANVGGEILAADEMCTHEEHSLCNGALHEDLVSCSLHGSRFSLRTGAPLEEPAREPLRTYAVRVDGTDILIAL